MNIDTYESNTGLRIVATLIDYILIFCFTIVYIYQFGEPSEDGGFKVSGLKGLVPFLFWFLYLPICEWKFCSTLGHWTVGLKIISENGEELTIGQTIKRRLSDIIDINWCFGLVAFVVVKSTDKKQRIGDIIAKTLVVKK
ncbi:RDD family protein [Cellulophaga fucicola]|uniref:Uncharacterized membrane protein YckC, RDD family n=1 Tax=Cellulophaga fucicola TaxID=76595 RepID=A0A1K1NZ36_9FLAO|nr:RDD family protein [Cellulophaga fucicola]SFW39662.1 Uncharacterized membrane protein YckC, RDD family [Cellulophaga fucicola]